ncbi:MAG: hypothetical protein COB67_13080 [SAR324 cluster bacterium]|uniref:Serine aminopeptidase S33 domain-containing protein n=1 Tax=SAR324 cluster bacterium TaxID=2024889 RepID=A0A2A4SQ99_9DELT|nr:MAG: hypothetical protein COB67_13080 [SAR324 cluster bacterium]
MAKFKIRWKMNAHKIVLILILLASFSFIGCTAKQEQYQTSAEKFSFPWDQGEFSDYLLATKKYISRNRFFLDAQHRKLEIEANSPFELYPDPQTCPISGKPEKGLLLIHGLSDSPYSMRDLAEEFSKKCFLVRTILLPGHGTRPGDSTAMTADEWYQVSTFALETLKKDVKHVYAGGFSTGANISTWLALKDPSIRGLVLFSPAFSLKWEYPTSLATLDLFIDWLNKNPIEDYAKYTSFSINSLRQFYITSARVQEEITKGNKLKIPVFIALSGDDSVVDVSYVKNVFQENLDFPGNRMMYFTQSQPSPQQQEDPRIVYRVGNLPDQQIASISHMAIPNRINNPHYGKNGDYRSCHMTDSNSDYEPCMQAERASLWHGAWGSEAEGKIFSRLTFNPYFDEMVAMSLETILSPKVN